VLTFSYGGHQLALLLAAGDYWGYLYVTVDGQPANQLAVIAGNTNSRNEAAGYRTLYAPEWVENGEIIPRWQVVHQAAGPGPHEVRVEVWRSWGMAPLRGVAVDALPAPARPRWPGVLLCLLGGWLLVLMARLGSGAEMFTLWKANWVRPAPKLSHTKAQSHQEKPLALLVALAGVLLVGLGVGWPQWLVVLVGLGLIGLAALRRPALWLAALLFGLPFYYRFPLPLLPGRALGLIDIGLLGGLGLLLVRRLVTRRQPAGGDGKRAGWRLWMLASWALVAALAADNGEVAWREWRVIFLAAALFGLLLQHLCEEHGQSADSSVSPLALGCDQWLLLLAWVGGGMTVALIGLSQYVSGANLISAEGVWRVRAFYGSPNNLALYLERTFAFCLAMALFAPPRSGRWLWSLLAVGQGLALVLTFSKGALLLALPALLVALWLGGLVLLRRRERSLRALWWIVVVAAGLFAAVLPFVGAERFQRLLDLSQGTGFLRLNLWRSAWQMALDHPWLGVGPDNFLYAYRSLYLLPAAWQEPHLNHPHNWLLDWWTRLGLPGLALALLFFGWLLARHRRGLTGGQQPVVHLGLLAASVAGLTHGLIDASYALPDLMLVWVLVGWVGEE
jgi:hypothetical protein